MSKKPEFVLSFNDEQTQLLSNFSTDCSLVIDNKADIIQFVHVPEHFHHFIKVELPVKSLLFFEQNCKQLLKPGKQDPVQRQYHGICFPSPSYSGKSNLCLTLTIWNKDHIVFRYHNKLLNVSCLFRNQKPVKACEQASALQCPRFGFTTSNSTLFECSLEQLGDLAEFLESNKYDPIDNLECFVRATKHKFEAVAGKNKWTIENLDLTCATTPTVTLNICCFLEMMQALKAPKQTKIKVQFHDNSPVVFSFDVVSFYLSPVMLLEQE